MRRRMEIATKTIAPDSVRLFEFNETKHFLVMKITEI